MNKQDFDFLHHVNTTRNFEINPYGKKIRGIKPFDNSSYYQYDFENALDFLDALDVNKSELYKTVYNEPYTEFIYRGHKYHDWSLIPSAYRITEEDKDSKMDKVAVYKSGNGPTQYKEIENFISFVKGMDELGLSISDSSYNFMLEAESKELLFDSNEGDPASYLKFPKESYYPELALAQHYGVKTRLLDFTTSALTALFFASENAYPFEWLDRDNMHRIGVWVIPKALIWLVSLEKPYIKFINLKKYQNKYISAQNGVFLNYFPPVIEHKRHGEHTLDITITLDKHLSSKLENPKLEDLRNNVVGKPMLFTLPHNELMEITSRLKQLNISWTTLMPSLDGVRREVNRLCSKPFDNKI